MLGKNKKENLNIFFRNRIEIKYASSILIDLSIQDN